MDPKDMIPVRVVDGIFLWMPVDDLEELSTDWSDEWITSMIDLGGEG